MFKTLRGRFTLAFVVLSAGGIALVSLLINLTVNRQFELYIRQNMQERAGRIAHALADAYQGQTGWTPEFLMEIARSHQAEALDITLEHPPGTVVWRSLDAPAAENGALPLNPHRPRHLPDLNLEVPITSQGRQVAALRVSSGPAGIFSEHDLHFRASVNGVLLYSALGTAAVAVGAAWFMSRGIHRPLLAMTRVAEKMRTGDWKQRVPAAGALELQQLAEALNHLAISLNHHEEMRKRMTRDVAHELRTPLAVLRSHLEAIEDGIWDPTPDRIRLCHQEVMRLVRLVDDLGELAEAEGEALQLELIEVSVGAFLEPLARGYQPLFADKQIQFDYEAPTEAVRVQIDQDKASQVIINLLANAQKYTPAGGRVRLSAAADEHVVRIAVRDTGSGITPEEAARIFDRFYRGDPSRTRATGGSGLGLAIAKTLAEAHGGHIELESRPGAGAAFTFVLPRRAEKGKTVEIRPQRA